MSHETIMWIVFTVVVLGMLAIDLFVSHRKPHAVMLKESLIWTAIWIAVALLFMAGVAYELGRVKAMEFLAGYLIEKSLSVDNLFVFLLIFSYFKVEPRYQHEVLFWGILSALVMRAVFIWAGVAIIQTFHWVIYVFGGFLVLTGIKMAVHRETEIHPEKNLVIRACRKLLRVTANYEGGRFFVTREGKWWATPLFIVLMVVETTDIIFAVDSIPAVLAISTDPFIVYSSNVFAILGLRALFFALAGIMEIFHYLHYGLAVILTFVGVKMMLPEPYKIPIEPALITVGAILAASVLASMIWPKAKGESEAKPRKTRQKKAKST